MIRWMFVPLAVLALASCARTMTAESCAQADWRAIGYQDGAAGEPAGAFTDRAAPCADKGRAPDRIAYEAGWRAGMRERCTYENGYADGYGRERYRGVCPSEVAEAYDRGYRRGAEDGRRAGPRWWPGVGIGVSGGSSGRVGVGVGTGIGIGF